MPTFDITSEFNTQEITNAVDQAYREIVNRYDFRDTGTNIEFNEQTITLKSSTEERLKAAEQVLKEKFVKRNVSIKVKADNHKEVLSFSADSKEMNDAFECVCVQHEIDHLDGITMFDRKFVKPAAVSNKIGRNEKVTITKGTESKVLKYKKAQPMLEDGWTLSI